MPVDQCDDGAELGKLLRGQHVLLQQPDLVHRVAVELRDEHAVRLAHGQEVEAFRRPPVPGLGRDDDGRGMYRCCPGLSEQQPHLLDHLRVGPDKVLQFSVPRRLPEQPRPVRPVVEHGGDVVHRAVRHAVYAGDILQGRLELHRGEGPCGENPPAATGVVPLLEVLLDLLTAVRGVVDVDIRQGGVASLHQSLPDKGVRRGKGLPRPSDFYVLNFHRKYFLYRVMALTVWRLTPYFLARASCDIPPAWYFCRISSACALVSLALRLFSP